MKYTGYPMKDRDLSTPLKAIQQFCIFCMGGERSLVPGCGSEACPLFQYRLGTLPDNQGET